MIKAKAIFNFLLLFLFVINSNAQTSLPENKANTKNRYLEIPKDFLGKQIQLINRITGYPNKLYHYGSSGMDVDYSVVLRFELESGEYIRVIQEQFQNHTPQNDIIKTSVQKNHFDPTICFIPIVSSTKNYITVDIEFFKNDIQLFSPVSKRSMSKYQLQAIAKEAIHVNGFQLGENNIQISRNLNYTAEKSPEKHYSKNVSVEQLLTFRILPENPMKRRKWDPRVGNFYLENKRYSSDSYYIEKEAFLEVWKMEPVDTAAYFRGIPTRPKKPIVFYFDENVPPKWRKYIKQGVLDWLPVFEKIGFKDAIEVHDKPKDANWDDADPNYNMIRWVSSEIKDAQGNYISDPRTGEILNGTLTWYQNYFSTVNADYFINAAAVDPSARTPILPDSLFGNLMRETMAHEMGHALGLGHNMIASSAYPTDSLRSRNFLEKYSITPSIMDYAAYNFVAQPEDMPLRLLRKIGPYDYWAIEHAYKYVRPSGDHSKMAVTFSNEEINERLQNPYLQYMEQEWPEVVDPTNVTGDLGDDPFLTGKYALKNLKRIMPHIVEWSMLENGDPKILLSRYDALLRQLNSTFKNVIVLLGGQKNRFSNSEFILKTTDTEMTSEAMDFLSSNLFSNMNWLYNSELEEISNKELYKNSLEKIQIYALKMLLNKNRFSRLVAYDVKNNTSNTATLLRTLSNLILKNSGSEEIPLDVQEFFAKRVKELKQKATDNLILNHLLKKELDYILKTVKNKSETNKNQLLKGFYLELSKI
ncbi:hypothetical protein DF185_00320 [Marinifilum breve]|uniref:Zinc-dependent metalloprotease n=1 Tax=Marinifilum breve TaxID=2184082 RepID=A0A2V4A2K4_9BACT|nr:zinc-dependent metalloprotease [Marinifilum breve]PXY02573.1 hypothetical protein DF185_00320 [Marinifilum breve]